VTDSRAVFHLSGVFLEERERVLKGRSLPLLQHEVTAPELADRPSNRAGQSAAQNHSHMSLNSPAASPPTALLRLARPGSAYSTFTLKLHRWTMGMTPLRFTASEELKVRFWLLLLRPHIKASSFLPELVPPSLSPLLCDAVVKTLRGGKKAGFQSSNSLLVHL